MEIEFNGFELRMLLDIVQFGEVEAGTVGEFVCLQTLQSMGFVRHTGFTKHNEPTFGMTLYGLEALKLAANEKRIPDSLAQAVAEWKAIQMKKADGSTALRERLPAESETQ